MIEAKKDNTFCSYPFKELAMKNYDGIRLEAVWPCCMMGNKTSVSKNIDKLGIDTSLTIDEMFNHPRMKLLRDNLLSGVKDSACHVCWEQEDRSLTSFRQFSPPLQDSEVEDPQLRTVDFTASNICNLRCRMCSPGASNSLMEDQKFFEKNGITLDPSFWSSKPRPSRMTESTHWHWLMDNTDKITTVKASGGEPFYDTKVVKLIDRYIETGNAAATILRFHTNGTVITDDMIDKLNQFKSNEHTFSVDGYGTAYDYVRYPSTFDHIDYSIRNYLNKMNNAKHLHVSIVVSALNVMTIDNFSTWANSLRSDAIVHYAELYPLTRGTGIFNLPVYLLEDIKSRLSKLNISTGNFANLKTQIDNAIVNNTENKQALLDEIIPFDRSRNQSYRDFLHPDLVAWLDN